MPASQSACSPRLYSERLRKQPVAWISAWATSSPVTLRAHREPGPRARPLGARAHAHGRRVVSRGQRHAREVRREARERPRGPRPRDVRLVLLAARHDLQQREREEQLACPQPAAHAREPRGDGVGVRALAAPRARRRQQREHSTEGARAPEQLIVARRALQPREQRAEHVPQPRAVGRARLTVRRPQPREARAARAPRRVRPLRPRGAPCEPGQGEGQPRTAMTAQARRKRGTGAAQAMHASRAATTTRRRTASAAFTAAAASAAARASHANPTRAPRVPQAHPPPRASLPPAAIAATSSDVMRRSVAAASRPHAAANAPSSSSSLADALPSSFAAPRPSLAEPSAD